MKLTFRNTTLLLVILLTLLAMVVSYAYLKKGEKILLREITNDMEGIVKMKAVQITNWYTDELTDAGLIAGNYLLIEQLEKFINQDAAAEKEDLKYFLESVAQEHDYASISLFNMEQQLIVSTKKTTSFESAVIEGMKQVLLTQQKVSTGLYTSIPDSMVYINFIAPVFKENSEKPLSLVNFQVQANESLYPMIDLFPLHWESFDLQLLRLSDNQITYLSNMLAHKKGEIYYNLESVNDDYVVVKVVSGMKGVIEGVDYRGRDVYAFSQPLQNTPWFLVAKIDRKVIVNTLWGNVIMIIIVTLLSILITLAGMAFLYNLRQKKLYRDMLLNRQEFRTTLYSIGDAVITTNSKGQINLLNPVAENLTRWKESEAVGKPLEKIFRIINEDTRAIVESPFKKVMETGNIVGLANHTLLISKDGTETPIADSGAPLRDEQNNITGVVLVFRDQSEQRIQQKLLKASEAKYRQLVESTDSIAWEYDIEQDKWTYVSPTVTGKLGWLPGEWKDLEFWKENLHPDVREEATNYCLSCAAKGESHVLEYPFRGKNGDYIWLRDVVSVEMQESKPFKLRGVMLDITERKNAEIGLKEKNTFIQTVLDNLPIGVALNKIDEGTAFYMNQRFKEIYGWSEPELRDIPSFFEKVYPDEGYRNKVVKMIMEGIESGDPKKMHWENIQITRSDGTTGFVNAVNIPLPDQNTMVSTVMDVTTHTLAQVELRESEERFRKAILLAPIPIMVHDQNGNVINLSEGWTNFSGYSIEEIPTLKEWTKKAYGKKAEEVEKYVNGMFDENKTVLSGEFEINSKSGETRIWNFYTTPLGKSSSGNKLMLSMAPDITQRKEVQNELIIAKEKAEESNRLKSAFLANMSHEIRTPLNGILGFTGLITGGELPPKNKRREYSEIINRSAESLMQLINDILDISKLDSGQFVIESHEFNLNELLDSLYAIFRKKMVDTGKQAVKLNIEKKENGLFLIGDEKRLIQIFTNLLDNAVKFTPIGEISFGIKEITPENIVFHVSDTGIGIEKSRQHIIFERFSQADDSISRNFGGTGLGLSIVQKLLELMGGQIHLKSEKGKGSSFIFLLPNTIKTDYHIQITHQDKNYKLNRRLKVLLVEDDPASQMYYQEILSKSKLDLMVAGNGRLGLELAESEKPDVILMDIRLPDISGLEVVKQIRNSGNKVKIIAQSAYAMEADQRMAIEAGCNDFISKPVKAELLYSKLEGISKK